jgi:hypothetical protein
MRTATDYRRAALTCNRCPWHWHGDAFCVCDPFGCPYYKALTGPQRDLHVSGVPDPMVPWAVRASAPTPYNGLSWDAPLITGPSIRRDLARASRARRLLAWLTTAGQTQTWALAALAVAVAVAVVVWGGQR